ncbi:MAG: D-cysteine desulfhydrase family protein [Alphaproteobacteria bacterium]
MNARTPPHLSLARTPTPLMPLDKISRELDGPRLWVKRDDLTGSVLSGNKVRKLEFAIADALEQGADTLITCGGTQSNHCRATAIAGAQLGLKVHLVLAGSSLDEPDGNLLLDRVVGADITLVAPEEFDLHLDRLLEAIADDHRRRGRKPYVVPLGASNEVGVWGYIGAAEELKADCDRLSIKPDVVAFATGSGGTQGGLVLGNALHGLGARIIGYSVSWEASELAEKIRGDLRSWRTRYGHTLDVDRLPIEVDDRYIGPGYGKAEPPVFETIRRLGRLEGLVLDPVYTGKAFHALLSELKGGGLKGVRNAVFVHTGGMFGLFPQRGALGF